MWLLWVCDPVDYDNLAAQIQVCVCVCVCVSV